MNMAAAVIKGDKWVTEFLNAIGMGDIPVRRIIVDAEVGHPVKIYVEQWGDERMFNVRPPGADEATVIAVGEK